MEGPRVDGDAWWMSLRQEVTATGAFPWQYCLLNLEFLSNQTGNAWKYNIKYQKRENELRYNYTEIVIAIQEH